MEGNRVLTKAWCYLWNQCCEGGRGIGCTKMPLVLYVLMWQLAMPRFSRYCWW
jgi:hypothetical protein